MAAIEGAALPQAGCKGCTSPARGRGRPQGRVRAVRSDAAAQECAHLNSLPRDGEGEPACPHPNALREAGEGFSARAKDSARR